MGALGLWFNVKGVILKRYALLMQVILQTVKIFKLSPKRANNNKNQNPYRYMRTFNIYIQTAIKVKYSYYSNKNHCAN